MHKVISRQIVQVNIELTHTVNIRAEQLPEQDTYSGKGNRQEKHHDSPPE